MILSGQHFHYAPMRMYFRSNSRPDPWREAMQGCLDVFVDKSTRMVIVS